MALIQHEPVPAVGETIFVYKYQDLRSTRYQEWIYLRKKASHDFGSITFRRVTVLALVHISVNILVRQVFEGFFKVP